MPERQSGDAAVTAKEGADIRSELDRFMTSLPAAADGFMLRIWRTGPNAGHPKIPPAGRSLTNRGLMRLDTSARQPHLYFTEAGLAPLRRMMANRRLADPEAFAHIQWELGIDPMPPVEPDE